MRAGQRVVRFDNGYGASIISDGYGSESGLKEIAVIKYAADGSYSLTYDTPITDDVLGWLTDEEVSETLGRIAALNPVDIAAEQANRKRADVDRLRSQIAELEAEIATLESE